MKKASIVSSQVNIHKNLISLFSVWYMYHYTKISHVCFNTYLLKQYMVYNKPSFILVQKFLRGLREPSFSVYF